MYLCILLYLSAKKIYIILA